LLDFPTAVDQNFISRISSQFDVKLFRAFFQDSILKRADIKKEESGVDEEMLSRSLDCISFVKLLRPALPKPKYVPSDNPSLLGRPVKDFKKFRKQVR
jgi:hypothetical protein